MPSKSNTKKSKQLGMPIGTASARLRKNIMFSMAKELKRDICFHCKNKIESLEEFSIEHKVPWLDNDPKLFWDLDNIAFSHLSCNIKASRNPNEKPIVDGKYWCWKCKEYKELSEFLPSRVKRNQYCRNCWRVYRNEFRKRTGRR